jgi:hypothetical protein
MCGNAMFAVATAIRVVVASAARERFFIICSSSVRFNR